MWAKPVEPTHSARADTIFRSSLTCASVVCLERVEAHTSIFSRMFHRAEYIAYVVTMCGVIRTVSTHFSETLILCGRFDVLPRSVQSRRAWTEHIGVASPAQSAPHVARRGGARACQGGLHRTSKVRAPSLNSDILSVDSCPREGNANPKPHLL